MSKEIVGRVLERNAALFGNQTAVIFEHRVYTHRQVLERVYRLANALAGRGLARQERIAVLARNSSEYLELFGACEVAGFILVTLNTRLSVSELAAICADCQPTVLVFSDEHAAAAMQLRAGLAGVRLFVSIGEFADRGVESYEALLAEGAAEKPALRARSTDTAYIIYTSGSTGRPKGVKKPRMIDFLESLPRLFNGKIDKKALRAPYWAHQGRAVS
jgi:acyl-CoA synthetase (AMP-forming)/AMP-acid ligase II